MSTTFPSTSPDARRRGAGTPAAGKVLMALLARLDRGRLELHTPDGDVHRFGPGGAPCDGTSATRACCGSRTGASPPRRLRVATSASARRT
jgi:hypothetical protein